MVQFNFDHKAMRALTKSTNYKCTTLYSDRETYHSLSCITFAFNKDTAQLVTDHVHLVSSEQYTGGVTCARSLNIVNSGEEQILLETAQILRALYSINDYNFDQATISLGNAIQSALVPKQNDSPPSTSIQMAAQSLLVRSLDALQYKRKHYKKRRTLTTQKAVKLLLQFTQTNFHLLHTFQPFEAIQSGAHILSPALRPEDVNGIRILLSQSDALVVCVRLEKLHVQFPERYSTYVVRGAAQYSPCRTWKLAYTYKQNNYTDTASFIQHEAQHYIMHMLFCAFKVCMLSMVIGAIPNIQ